MVLVICFAALTCACTDDEIWLGNTITTSTYTILGAVAANIEVTVQDDGGHSSDLTIPVVVVDVDPLSL